MSMQYKTFGRRSGLRVSQLALGAGNFGTGWGHGADKAEAKAMFDTYIDAGGNFIDTADVYQGGQSEQFLGELMAAERDNLVIATKYTLNGKHPGTTGNSRKNMMQAVDASLKRMGTDRIDLYWAHFADGLTPIEEILRGFDDLVRSGKILYAGLSNFPAWRVARADLMAELRGWSPLIGLQFEYSLAERTADRELLPMTEALGLGGTLWSPLAGGFLTGKYRAPTGESRLQNLGKLVHSESSGRETAILDTVLAIAAEADAPPAHVAIAWLLARDAQSSTALVPLLGPRTKAQLDATLGALKLTLSPAHIARLDHVSAVDLGTPYRQIADSADTIAGGQPSLRSPKLHPVA
ncbi:aldo/keto reductase [Massilia sp. CF038]|uniref:aldo/keto reductase n=1 Tax=Massilia sp. CF038 TaxID=1881045 RepID=UPI00091A0B7D|nr:aldo/keto reductase [Massilia sp. CF038]SHG66127.1 Predicted oxidoreductase [Massilia sp. CF038]